MHSTKESLEEGEYCVRCWHHWRGEIVPQKHVEPTLLVGKLILVIPVSMVRASEHCNDAQATLQPAILGKEMAVTQKTLLQGEESLD